MTGRIGRGAGTGNCDCLLLFDDSNPESQAQYQARLQTLVDNNDGFAIADADLRFRGPGDVLGTRQSGDSKFRGIHLTHHMELIPVAMKLAEVRAFVFFSLLRLFAIVVAFAPFTHSERLACCTENA